MCRHWIELDKESGHIYEYCKAKQQRCSCAGGLSACNFPLYFNIPVHRIKDQRARDRMNDTVASIVI